ncbi:Uncharacterised protein [Mycobacteroides abscessus subsp. abscessus]|nr:Uncharacterised protein [Mycobacteroides abscessus subsp. abscessus]
MPWASIPGDRNAPSSATTLCGSSSLLVQVTVVPAGTVRVGGLKAKFSMLTAGPAGTGNEGAPAAVGIDVVTGIFGMA